MEHQDLRGAFPKQQESVGRQEGDTILETAGEHEERAAKPILGTGAAVMGKLPGDSAHLIPESQGKTFK